MSSVRSYTSIYPFGHRTVQELLLTEVIVEEKVDGSQFSFGVYGQEREFRCRSKGAVVLPDAPPGLLSLAVKAALAVRDSLQQDWTYRGEVLAKPKHNVLAYDRAPSGNVIIWDIDRGFEDYLSPADKAAEAKRIGLECAPLLFQGRLEGAHELRKFLDTTSILGGQKIEGVVVKPAAYNLFGVDKKLLVAKLVSEDFKEVHSATGKKEHGERSGKDIIAALASQYATPARWAKAKIHLKEAGLLTGEMRDIGALVKEVSSDVEKECAEEIGQALYEWAWPQLRRSLVKGLPEWFKEQMVKEAFEGGPQ